MTIGKNHYHIISAHGTWKVLTTFAFKAGVKISALVTFKGRSSKTIYIFVVPSTPRIEKPSVGAMVVKGMATKNSVVYVKVGAKISFAKASINGHFTVEMAALKKDATLTVYCKAGGQVSGKRILKV